MEQLNIRQILEWEWYGDTNMVRVYLHLLLKANTKASFWRGLYIGRGCLITSAAQLSHETGLTVKQVRLVLKKLIDGKEIVTMRARKKSLITICKFDSYDTSESDGGHEKGANQVSLREETKKENREEKEQEKESFPLKPPYKEKEKEKEREKEKNDDLDDNAHAREIESLKTYNQWVEGICMNHRISYDVFLAKVDEFSLDMICGNIDITKIENLRAYFNKWLTNKKRENNGQRTYIADPVAKRNYERNQRLQSVAARAATLAPENYGADDQVQ